MFRRHKSTTLRYFFPQDWNSWTTFSSEGIEKESQIFFFYLLYFFLTMAKLCESNGNGEAGKGAITTITSAIGPPLPAAAAAATVFIWRRAFGATSERLLAQTADLCSASCSCFPPFCSTYVHGDRSGALFGPSRQTSLSPPPHPLIWPTVTDDRASIG